MNTSGLRILREAANSLLRPATGELKNDFLVPGSIYQAEQWDWDSYWMARGMFSLASLLDDKPFHQDIVRHSQGCLYNLFEHQASNGTLPIMMRADNPDMFGCLDANGAEVNQAKPVIGQFVRLISEQINDYIWFNPYLTSLARFYKRWREHYGSQIGLLTWGSDVAIGIDNDPTAYGRPGFSSANLLLNCLYIQDLKDAAHVANALGRKDLESAWEQEAMRTSDALVKTAWDPRDRFFYSHDVLCTDHRSKLIPWAAPGMPMEWQSLPIRIQSFTGFLPLWCGTATQSQADALREHMLNPETFHATYGIRTLSRMEPMFSLAQSNNPSNWLGPIWILCNYLVWSGLRRYAYKTEASDLAKSTFGLLSKDLQDNCTLHEYYHPESGTPLMNKGFLSWDFLVCEMLLHEGFSSL